MSSWTSTNSVLLRYSKKATALGPLWSTVNVIVVPGKTVLSIKDKPKPKFISVPSKDYESDLEDFDSGAATFIDDDISKEKPKVTKKIKHTEFTVSKTEKPLKKGKTQNKEVIINDDCGFID